VEESALPSDPEARPEADAAVDDGGGWVRFEGPLELLVWGRNTCTVLYLGDQLLAAVTSAATRRVEGRIDGVEVNLGVNRADVAPHPFVYVGAALRRRLGVRAGEVVECRLRPTDPDVLPVPADVRAALDAAGLRDTFGSHRPAERRRLLRPIEDAVRDATRRRRIQSLLRALSSTDPANLPPQVATTRRTRRGRSQDGQ
jgi:hypothetical protein